MTFAFTSASFPVCVTIAFHCMDVPAKRTVSSDVQPLNAYAAIATTLSGIVISVSAVQ